MSATPEMDKLLDRLFGDPDRQIQNIHISWGPKAHLATAEERAAHMNKVLDEVDAGNYVDVTPPRPDWLIDA